MSEQIQLSDGRTLAFERAGREGGLPVVFFHGVPGSRLYYSLADEHGAVAESAGVCVVSPDRPGIGRSSPRENRTIATYATDVAEFADALGWERFAAIGFSGGAPYALAAAAQLPERVGAVALVAPMCDLAEPWLRASTAPLVRHGVETASRATGFARTKALTPGAAQRLLVAFTDFVWATLPISDRTLLAVPEVRELERRILAEAAAQGLEGPRLDAELLGRGWDFDAACVVAPVSVHIGTADPWSTEPMAAWLNERLPHAEVLHYESEGHFTVLVSHIREVLQRLADDFGR